MPGTLFSRLAVAMSLWLLALLLFAPASFAQSDAPLHYYDSAIGLTGAPLKAALQAIIRNHTVLPYTSAATDTWKALKVLDPDPAQPTNVVLVYSGLVALASDQFNGQTGSWEREHLWPQSFGIVALNSNSRARNDLFNLRPINPSVNSSRGNKFYDTSTAPIATRPDAPGSSYDGNSWEPRQTEKGAIARAMVYMAVRYDGSDTDVPDLELSDTPNAVAYRFGKLTTLLAWHRAYAVAAAERERNQRIYTDYQHNRNPFVDHPDYVEMVYSGVSANQAWRDTNFTDPELADPTISGDAADPEGDGVSNLLEYVFARDPWQAEGTPALAVSSTSQGGSYRLLVSYSHNRNATDVAISYEVSTNQQTWTAATPELLSDTVTSSEAEQITVRFAASTVGYSVRVRATRVSP